MEYSIELCLLIFGVAILYSAVGHGGASGYLAVLSFFLKDADVMAITALTLNVLVASLAFWNYYRARHFSWALIWPFLCASVPAALLGGMLKIEDGFYFSLLAIVLTIVGIRLIFSRKNDDDAVDIAPFHPWKVGVPVAGGIGFLSGVLGVGGGIFLSPIMLCCRWATAKQTAATSACFIVINSLAGLGGRYLRGDLVYDNNMSLLLLAAFLGSLVGSYVGANWLSNRLIRNVLGVVLIIAAVKMVVHYGS